ncbi:uncharacterized protein FOBCDRAFT_164753 [Fusarium oxysporum Fo47]|uniref:uncharacterized protein n=1 Tax=Fusarium oxysporum Fo47 TaxID=660027 RepID=UPI002869AB34|nr:uncharacterized protein FOBCDRAFT_164753 [Fusarium oxysporum Fo47]QKD57101.2 hypothetical protein FOBCDRAFT_164753 [Fusarium oxysporum Fo47]
MAEAAPTPRRPDEPELTTNYLHGLVVAFRVVQCEVPNLILDAIGVKDVQYFGRNVVSEMASSQFRYTKRQLAWLAILIPKERSNPVQAVPIA